MSTSTAPAPESVHTAPPPADPPAVAPVVRARHLVAGERREGGAGRIERVDPATGEATASAPVGGAPEVQAAVAAARAAARDWAATPAAERAGHLRDLAAGLAAERDALAEDTRLDMGRPLELGLGGVDAAVGTIGEYAVLGPLHRGARLNGAAGAWDVMERRPRGVAAVITAWNDPVAASVGLLAAALATGNTVVWKPSERAVRTSERLTALLDRHLPAGVVNVVTGDASTGALVSAAPVDVVGHIGSTVAGRRIAAAAAVGGTRTVLENGGNDPLVVDAGVDPAWAAAEIALGAFVNSGQLCTGVERVYVHAEVYDAVRDALLTEARAWGPGGDRAVGPLVDLAHRDVVHGHVAEAVAGGARLLAGGEVPEGPGAWYPPTVLEDVPAAALVLTEETFGPVVPLVRVPTFDEGMRLAGEGRYGLAATVLSPDLAHVQAAVRDLDVGTVKVNAVFGGAPGGAAHPRRGSGDGFGYGPELLDEFTAVTVWHVEPARRA